MNIQFKPMLGAAIDNVGELNGLKYPLIASPKLDGIRCVILPDKGPVTRSLKPIRSRFVHQILNQLENYCLDGEICCGANNAPDVFNRTTSGVMASDASDDFVYWVFDRFVQPEISYLDRWITNEAVIKGMAWRLSSSVRVLPWVIVNSPEEVLESEDYWLSEGYEGIMLRDPNAGYKFGRSTLKGQHLLKLKRFKDAEATVVGYEPRFRNQNEATRDNLGYLKRSSHQSGQIEDSALGALLVRDESGRFGNFAVGSGYTEDQRRHFWNTRDNLVGKRISYRYQEVGVLDAPRFPTFKGFRED